MNTYTCDLQQYTCANQACLNCQSQPQCKQLRFNLPPAYEKRPRQKRPLRCKFLKSNTCNSRTNKLRCWLQLITLFMILLIGISILLLLLLHYTHICYLTSIRFPDLTNVIIPGQVIQITKPSSDSVINPISKFRSFSIKADLYFITNTSGLTFGAKGEILYVEGYHSTISEYSSKNVVFINSFKLSLSTTNISFWRDDRLLAHETNYANLTDALKYKHFWLTWGCGQWLLRKKDSNIPVFRFKDDKPINYNHLAFFGQQFEIGNAATMCTSWNVNLTYISEQETCKPTYY